MLSPCRFPFALAFAIVVVTVAAETWGSNDYVHFVTEPFINTYRPRILEQPSDPSVLQSGYLFYSLTARAGDERVGPHIVDQNGELVWYGNHTTYGDVYNFRTCSWGMDALDHLCLTHVFTTELGDTVTEHRVIDRSYSLVSSGHGHAGNTDMRDPSPLEFDLAPAGRSFVQIVNTPRPFNLTAYGGPAEGHVLDSCIEDIDVDTGNATFSWCVGDHDIRLADSFTFPNSTEGDYGTGELQHPWNAFHLNSVHKDPAGDYLASLAHMNTVVKIAGSDNYDVYPGTVLWRLGGHSNQFQHSELADLSRQHHVRHVHSTVNETTLSVFNNQLEAQGRRLSNAQLITLSPADLTVLSVRKFHHPEGLVSQAMGSTQVLPNGNILVGWGTLPQLSEFSPTGALLYHAHLDKYDPTRGLDNSKAYRVLKSNWTGAPATPAKLVVYTRSCQRHAPEPLTAYVSWNGATSVHSWRFATDTGRSPNAPWVPAGVFRRTGFETKATLLGRWGRPFFAHRVRVEGLGAAGEVLVTAYADTFVPRVELVRACGTERCARGFVYAAEKSRAGGCEAGGGDGAGWDVGWVLGVGVVVVGALGGIVVRYLRPGERKQLLLLRSYSLAGGRKGRGGGHSHLP